MPLRIGHDRDGQQPQRIPDNPARAIQVAGLMLEQLGEFNGGRIRKDLCLPAFLEHLARLHPHPAASQKPGEPQADRPASGKRDGPRTTALPPETPIFLDRLTRHAPRLEKSRAAETVQRLKLLGSIEHALEARQQQRHREDVLSIVHKDRLQKPFVAMPQPGEIAARDQRPW